MTNNEKETNLFVYDLAKKSHIELEPDGSSVKEIADALKTASKNKTGSQGFPDYTGVVKDFLLVIEDKKDTSKQIKFDNNGSISFDDDAIKNYAVNGAIFYAQHILKNTNYKKIIAIGISGNEKFYKITPVFIKEDGYQLLNDIDSLEVFNEYNIENYYIKEVLKEKTEEEKTADELLKDAKELHERLRDYGSVKETDKPLIVSGILLALREKEYGNFSVESLTGDSQLTDGVKIYQAIESNLGRTNVPPDISRIMLSQFAVIKDTKVLNEINEKLKTTPLKNFADFIDKHFYSAIKELKTSEDYIGRFYSEFMSYSTGDGKTLGIVLTPKHITDLFCDLADIKSDDVVLDPCCGSGGFLVAAMHHMIKKANGDDKLIKNIKENQLHGIELQPYMFTIAATNMILRGDGKSNIINNDFFKEDTSKLQKEIHATVGMINPPYSQGKKDKDKKLSELSFILHLLGSLKPGAKCIAIVPQSSMVGKTSEEQKLKEQILQRHTLEGVITLNEQTFNGVAGVVTCIAVFTAGHSHPADKRCKFIDFRDDGFVVMKHRGLIETESSKEKKQHLLDVWFDKVDESSKFCIKTTIKPDDEWLHSFYYWNGEIPTEDEFEKSVSDYLTFEFSMIMQNREYLFNNILQNELSKIEYKEIEPLDKKEWKEFNFNDIFKIKRGQQINQKDKVEGNIPRVSSSVDNNAIESFIDPPSHIKNYSNALTLNNNGNVGYCFYHPYQFVPSVDSTVVTLKNNDIKLTKYIALFLKTNIELFKNKYNYGRKLSNERLLKEKIYLPLDKDKNIDWNYMEQYTKNIIYKKLTQYLNYLKEKGYNVNI